MATVPNRANDPKRMMGRAGRFVRDLATWGATNAQHNDNLIMRRQTKERNKPLQPAKDLSGAYGIKPEPPVRKNEWKD